MKTLKSLTVLFLLFFAGAWLGWSWFMGLDRPPEPYAGSKSARPFSVAQGMSDRKVAEKLRREGLVRNDLYFLYVARQKGLEGKIRAGEYSFPPSLTTARILDMLTAGPEQRFFRITIPEGFTLKDIARRASARLGCGEGDFLSIVSGPEFLRGAFGGLFVPGSAEGYLFPETYTLEKGDGCGKLAALMAKQFVKVAREENLQKRANDLGMTMNEAVTLASMIEWEAKFDNERPTVSAVYHNRLKKKMLLQCDATVQYVLPERKSRLLFKDLEIDSPYNTYKYPGLPPGPIGSPGRRSLAAAVAPDDVAYLYYVADGTGRHVFTNSLREHNAAISKIRGANQR